MPVTTISLYDYLTDAANAPVVGVSVSLILEFNGATTSTGLVQPTRQTVTTDSAGKFTFPAVIPTDLFSPANVVYTLETPFRNYQVTPQSGNGASQQSTAANVIVNTPYALAPWSLTTGPLTVTGELTAADLSLTGLTGATALGRFVGFTSYGAPTGGSFVAGDWVISKSSAATFVCITAGTPGTWINYGGVFDVRDQGAGVSFSAANNATAINAAITAAQAAHGGVVLVPVGLGFTNLVADDTTGVVLQGLGGLSSGATTATLLTSTATSGTLISARSTNGYQMRDIFVLASGAAYTGLVVDTSHSGAASDSNFAVIERCRFDANGTANPSVLVSLDKTLRSTVRDCTFGKCTIALRGAVDNTSYSNANNIVHNNFNTSTGVIATSCIRNPNQGWGILNNTFEGGNAAGALAAIDFSGSGAAANGCLIAANWMGDVPGAVALTWMSLVGSGISVLGNYIAGSTASTAISIASGSTGIFIKGNDFETHSVGVALASNVRLDYGANTVVNVTTEISGTPGAGSTIQNGLGLGIGMVPANPLDVTGLARFSTDIIMSAAISQIRPGATSFAVRDSTNAANNIHLSDAGVATFRNNVNASNGLTSGTKLVVGNGVSSVNTTDTSPVIYATSGSGSGIYASGGHLIIQSRPSGAVRDIYLVAGTSQVSQAVAYGAGGFGVLNGPIFGNMTTEAFSGAITITVDGTKGNTHLVPATSNTASTLTPSAAGTAGQWLYLVFTSDGTGGNVITFANTFRPNGTLTLGISKKQVVAFISDGSNWIEYSRGAAV